MTIKKLFGLEGARKEVDEIMNEESTDTEFDHKPNLTGKIIYLNNNGWGFITSKEIPFEKIYFYWEGLKQGTLKFPELKKNMKVTFDAIDKKNEKGWQAIKIEVIDDKRSIKKIVKE